MTRAAALALLAFVAAALPAAVDADGNTVEKGAHAHLIGRVLLLIKKDGKTHRIKLRGDGTFEDLKGSGGNPKPETWRIVGGELAISWNGAYALYSIPDCALMAYGLRIDGEAYNQVHKRWTYTLGLENPEEAKSL